MAGKFDYYYYYYYKLHTDFLRTIKNMKLMKMAQFVHRVVNPFAEEHDVRPLR